LRGTQKYRIKFLADGDTELLTASALKPLVEAFVNSVKDSSDGNSSDDAIPPMKNRPSVISRSATNKESATAVPSIIKEEPKTDIRSKVNGNEDEKDGSDIEETHTEIGLPRKRQSDRTSSSAHSDSDGKKKKSSKVDSTISGRKNWPHTKCYCQDI
jgi:hypothetical protein